LVLAERMAGLRLGSIKLSPLLRDDFLELLGTRLEFVSFGRECREALVWVGEEAVPGRFAVHIESGESLESGTAGGNVDEPGRFLFEADPAAIRAHCLGYLCRRHSIATLGDSNGYLTGDSAIGCPWLKSYAVLEHGKWDLKAARASLVRWDSAAPTVKQRGGGLDVVALRKQLSVKGSRPTALAIWPNGRSLRYALLDDAVL
jgi:hypothetical protein